MLLVLLTGVAGAIGAQEPGNKSVKPAGQERARGFYLRSLLRGVKRPALLPAAVVAETEPNNAATEADRVALGDQATGEVNPAGDADYFVFSVPAATSLDIDVDAAQVGSPLDPTLELFSTDGVTSLAFNDDFDGLDSRILYTISVAGDYFIAIRGFDGGGGPGSTYTINFNQATPGPGDPTTVFASGLQGPGGMAFDGAGNLFVAELAANRVSRVMPSGMTSVFASNILEPRGVAFGGSAELLVASGDGNVYKVSATGVPTAFLTGLSIPFWIATGPDGSIWVADAGNETLRRYNESGALQQSVDVSSFGGAYFLAFSPAGELYFSNAFEIYKLVGGQPQFFTQGPPFLEGFAFDAAGKLYVANELRSRVILYAANGTVMADPFAVSNLASPVNVAFGRRADGTTSARLFASDFANGTIVEMNPAGIGQPGWPVPSVLAFAKAALRAGVMGASYADTLTLAQPGVTPTWSLKSGALPRGVSLGTATWILNGVPEEAGTFSFRIRAEAGSRSGERNYSITVTEPALTVANVADRLLGVTGVLSADEVRYLDLLGNRNGRFDVGDFRAFVLSRPALARAGKKAP